ncbi:MAG: hypothetical protein HT580_05810 [Dechloromonas sp.]|nr:MAG: hypothetical protein HT580_05810 [Dechloromonas sp.]
MSALDREAGRNGVWLTERGCEIGTTGISRIAREKCANWRTPGILSVNLVQPDILKMRER